MQLDDLIGLLFFVFFVVLPALSGLFRRGQQPPDLDEPEILRPRPQPPQRTQQTSPPQRTPQPAQRPQPATKPAPPPQSKPRSEPRPVREAARRLEEYARQPAEQARRDPARSPQPPVPVIKASPQPLSTDKDAILKGVIWRQILEEPRGRHWQRIWSSARKRRRAGI